MLGQKSLAILGRLVLVKHGPGLGVLHHSPHELGSIGKVSLGLPELLCQIMETGGCGLGLGGELVIFADLMLPHELQSSGHLFEVIHLGPPLISRAFPGAQPLLYVHDQIDTPGRSWGRSIQLRHGALARNYIPDLPGIEAFPKSGRAEPSGPLLPRNKERDRTATPPLDRIAGLLHDPQKGIKAARAFGKGVTDGRP